jgi:hypothetical protein
MVVICFLENCYALIVQGYNSLKDYFPTMEMRPNPQCSNPACVQRQVYAFAHSLLVFLIIVMMKDL